MRWQIAHYFRKRKKTPKGRQAEAARLDQIWLDDAWMHGVQTKLLARALLHSDVARVRPSPCIGIASRAGPDPAAV
jgi:hypothetical protein